MKKKLFFAILPMATSAQADLPLQIDNIFANKHQFVLDSSISYQNTARDNQIAQYMESNSDTLTTRLGLRYGVVDGWDVGIKGAASYFNLREKDSDELRRTTDSRIQDVTLTSQYQLSKEHDSLPDSLVFAEISVYDNQYGLKPDYGSSWLVGGTVYTVNDPIFLGLSASYQHNAPRTLASEASSTTHSGVFSLNGQLNFLVNPEITLNSGVGWQYRQASKINGIEKSEGIDRTQTNLSLGLVYALTKKTNLSANITNNISGDNGSVFTIGLSTKF